MTIEETIEKLEFMKRAYQELRDASITDGGEWHSDERVLEEYQKYIDALEMAIKVLEKEAKWFPVSKQLIDELLKMPLTVTATAYTYAINYLQYGENVTEKWETATQNASALGKAYRRGYYDGLNQKDNDDAIRS